MRTIAMSTERRRFALAGVAGILLLVGATGIAGAQEKVDRTVQATAKGTVTIENLAGEVMVTGWDREEVHLTGTLDEQVEKLIFERDGDHVRIKVEYPRKTRNVDGSSLTVQVPRASRLEVSTVSAEIGVDEVSGSVEAESVSGDVEIAGEPAEVQAQSVSGNVTVTAQSPRIHAESVSGDLRLDGARGEASAESVSGEITVTGGRFDRFEGGSVSGDIEFHGELNADGTFSFESHSGDVVLMLPADVNADFEVETFSGDIDNGFGPQVGADQQVWARPQPRLHRRQRRRPGAREQLQRRCPDREALKVPVQPGGRTSRVRPGDDRR